MGLTADFKSTVLEGDHVKVVSNLTKKPKKITGTRLACILGINKYKSEFINWMEMMGLFYEPIDATLGITGNTIEPKIKDFVSKQYGVEYISYDPKACYFDMFRSDPIFGGLPDGEPSSDGKTCDYSKGYPMLEIKTSSIDKFEYKMTPTGMVMQKDANGLPKIKLEGAKKAEWFKNGVLTPPIEYQLQLSLYMYLRGINKGIIAVGFLQPIDYKNPENFDANKREIYIKEVFLDTHKFENEVINYAKNWYQKYIKGGISPKMSEQDKIWLKKYS